MVTRAGAARWARDLDQVVGRIAPRFARAEPRRRAGAYLGGCWRRWSARAASRWSVESRFEQAKDEVGPGHHAMRSWVGGHRHVTLSMLALAHLAAVRKAAARGADPAELAAVLLPLTVPEVRRLLRALVAARQPKPIDAPRWSTWRRRHQQRARRTHWHRRSREARP